MMKTARKIAAQASRSGTHGFIAALGGVGAAGGFFPCCGF
jgi:hypothetical protein